MKLTARNLTAVMATTALTAGAGLGVAQAQNGGGSPDRPAPRGEHRHGPGAAHLSALAQRLGVSTARLREALQAIRPARGERGPGPRGGKGDLAAKLATALGVEPAAVEEILAANRPQPPARGERPRHGERPRGGGRPPRPDLSRLVTALAEGLDVEEAKVKAALDALETRHRAEHDARHAEIAAALAKELGLDADDVEAALRDVPPFKHIHRRRP